MPRKFRVEVIFEVKGEFYLANRVCKVKKEKKKNKYQGKYLFNVKIMRNKSMKEPKKGWSER